MSETHPELPFTKSVSSTKPVATVETAQTLDSNLQEELPVEASHQEESSSSEESIKEFVQGLGLKVDLSKIPDKLEFKIGEVADMLGIKTYVLRFWETEFEALKPLKSKNNQRVYRRKDAETAFLIKTLLYDERYSIEGARSALKKARQQVKKSEHFLEIVDRQDRALNKLKEVLEAIRSVRTALVPAQNKNS